MSFRIFRIKGIKINKQSQNLTIVIDELMRSLFKIFFWITFFVSLFGYGNVWRLIKPLLEKLQ